MRKHIQAAADCDLTGENGLLALTEEKVVEIVLALRGGQRLPRGPDEWLATFADPLRAQSAIATGQ